MALDGTYDYEGNNYEKVSQMYDFFVLGNFISLPTTCKAHEWYDFFSQQQDILFLGNYQSQSQFLLSLKQHLWFLLLKIKN